MPFRCVTHALSECNSWPFGVQLMAFRCAIHALSVCNSYSFSARFMAFQCAIHALSVCNSCPFGVQFILFRCAIYGLSACDSQPYASGRWQVVIPLKSGIQGWQQGRRTIRMFSGFRFSAESRVYSKAGVPSGCFPDSAFQRNDAITAAKQKSSAPESSRSKGAAI